MDNYVTVVEVEDANKKVKIAAPTIPLKGELFFYDFWRFLSILLYHDFHRVALRPLDFGVLYKL